MLSFTRVCCRMDGCGNSPARITSGPRRYEQLGQYRTTFFCLLILEYLYVGGVRPEGLAVDCGQLVRSGIVQSGGWRRRSREGLATDPGADDENSVPLLGLRQATPILWSLFALLLSWCNRRLPTCAATLRPGAGVRCGTLCCYGSRVYPAAPRVDPGPAGGPRFGARSAASVSSHCAAAAGLGRRASQAFC